MNTSASVLEALEKASASETHVLLSTGRSRTEKQGRWKTMRSTFAELAAHLQNHIEGRKDGQCFLQGEAAGGTRKAMAMIANYIIGVDLDSGKPLQDVMDAIIDAGLEAVIYTTHSHLKNTSQIKRAHFLKWTDGEDPTPELVAEYLQVKKGLIPEVVQNVSIIDDAYHTEEGVVILVQHDPIPKFRAVFPLSEAFVFAKRGGPQKDAIAEWKERYAGFCTAMGFFYDETCADPARLFYLPRHKKGDEHGSWCIAGKPVDLDDYERVKVKRDRRTRATSGPANPWTDQNDGEDDDHSRYMIGNFSLIGWAKDHAKFFEVENLLTDVAPDMIRDPRGGKPGVHVECPFEAEHSTFGGCGCFVVNASDNYDDGYDAGFTFKCVHDACSHRDRLDMIKGCIEQGFFTLDELRDTAYMIEVEDEVGPASDDARDDKESDPKRPEAWVPCTKAKQDLESRDDEEARHLLELNQSCAVVTHGSKLRVLYLSEDPSEELKLLSVQDARNKEAVRNYWRPKEGGKGGAKIIPFNTWLEWPFRREFEEIVFDPGCTDPRKYNRFRGWAIEPCPGDWSILRDHLLHNVCGGAEDLFEWLTTWLAHLFQRPGEKPGSAIVIRGLKGCGKSIIFEFLAEILGKTFFDASSKQRLTGNFNSHLDHNLLFLMEEMHCNNDKGFEAILKDLITSNKQAIEQKHADVSMKRNFTRVAIVSNERWVVPATSDERRFAVFDCLDARRNDLPFFDAMARQMKEEGGLAAMLHDFLTFEPERGWSVLRQPPRTHGLHEQIYETLSEPEKLMFELLQTGSLELDEFGKDPIELQAGRETDVYATDLRAALRYHLKQMNYRGGQGLLFPEVDRLVQNWLGGRIDHISLPGKSNKKRCYVIPPLQEARAYAEKYRSVRFDL